MLRRLAVAVVALAPRGGTAIIGIGALPASAGARQTAAAVNVPAITIPFVLDGVTVIDMATGQHRAQQRVVIVGNRITAVGAAPAVRVPKGAKIVDARGRYLIPGLWDVHTHPLEARHFHYLLDIANGVTGIRDAHSGDQPVDTAVAWWHEILAGRQIGPPRQLLAGPYDPMASDESIAERKAKGVNFLKVYPFVPTLAEASHRVGLSFGGHVLDLDGQVPAEGALEASDSGISIIDHVNSSGGLDKICLGPDASIEQCQPLAERFRKNGTWFTPTLLVFGRVPVIVDQTRALGSIRQRLDRFTLDFLSADTVLRRNIGRGDSIRSDVRGFLEIAQRVGLPILAGTDVAGMVKDGGQGALDGIVPALAGFALHAELEAFVAEGLTPLNALQSATIDPAKMLHATDSLGTVAPGKLADLVLLDADPLADITNISAIRAVVADGHYYDRAALDQMLVDVRKEFKLKYPSPSHGAP